MDFSNSFEIEYSIEVRETIEYYEYVFDFFFGVSNFISLKTRKSYKINKASPEQLNTSTKQTYTDRKQPNKYMTLSTIVKHKNYGIKHPLIT